MPNRFINLSSIAILLVLLCGNVEAQDYYAVLGVGHRAGDAEIKSAWRKLARAHHDDYQPGNKIAAEKFRQAAEAYEVLINPEKRFKYDLFGIIGELSLMGVMDAQSDIRAVLKRAYPDFFKANFNFADPAAYDAIKVNLLMYPNDTANILLFNDRSDPFSLADADRFRDAKKEIDSNIARVLRSSVSDKTNQLPETMVIPTRIANAILSGDFGYTRQALHLVEELGLLNFRIVQEALFVVARGEINLGWENESTASQLSMQIEHLARSVLDSLLSYIEKHGLKEKTARGLFLSIDRSKNRLTLAQARILLKLYDDRKLEGFETNVLHILLFRTNLKTIAQNRIEDFVQNPENSQWSRIYMAEKLLTVLPQNSIALGEVRKLLVEHRSSDAVNFFLQTQPFSARGRFGKSVLIAQIKTPGITNEKLQEIISDCYRIYSYYHKAMDAEILTALRDAVARAVEKWDNEHPMILLRKMGELPILIGGTMCAGPLRGQIPMER